MERKKPKPLPEGTYTRMDNLPYPSRLPIDYSASNISTPSKKDTNPKDAVGVRKWRQFATVPSTVVWEVGVAMLEGARKYRRHNYRVVGVRSSVYFDAALGHITQWWEGEDIDHDSKLHHLTKAIASLVVLRDAQIRNKEVDDRPPKSDVKGIRDRLQPIVEHIIDTTESLKPYTECNLEE